MLSFFRLGRGEIVWHYQTVPNEMFDLAATWEWIADIPVNGEKRKVVMHMGRGGFLYVVDRTNGKLLAAPAFEKVNWATHVDLNTGRPVESDIAKRMRAGEQIELWPGQWGAKKWPHAAFNPNTGLLYANTMHHSRMVRFMPSEYKVGQRYQARGLKMSMIERKACAGVLVALAAAMSTHASAQNFAPEQIRKGADIYAQNCSPCHGAHMADPNSAFDLKTFPPDAKSRFVNSVTRRKNSMPPWGDLLKSDDIEALWAYVRAGER